ncbi:ATP-dependent nuclease [Herpetosiphon geysericola]|uniref:ATPase AAA-type core domain-containing protein n=1 Tax=Herpetosiphon geysericola TaxID=70996 RepID=A0A0P6Y508_9CHLR|nr:AAA family ATPase [Herpetosiphon geysericola]KPL80294.1 hypothetical protein SE18_24925 [Herpetosiphon geysericola]
MYQIETLYLPDSIKSSYQNVESQPLTQLDSLSRVNILVGENNAGKSRFMRLLAEESNFKLKHTKINEFNYKIEQEINRLIDIFDIHEVDRIEAITRINIENCIHYLKEINSIYTNPKYTTYNNIFNIIETIKNDNRISSIANIIINLLNQVQIKFNKNIYIPTLRSLRPLDSEYTDFYQNQTIESYFKSAIHKPEIYTGLGIYAKLRIYLLGDNVKRKKIREYQEFISHTLFEDKEVTLIPRDEEKHIFVKIGNEKERPIYDLGDGIQSAIILTFLPFVSLENCIFFIEEPELFLHPSMQRKILEFYHSLDRHLFFMTTHSNHLLDITIDIPEISIYNFRKSLTSSDDDETPHFIVENVDNNQTSSLELLGVRNSSVLLVNATIWVEGITDRWYLREMLQMYMESQKDLKQFVEDMHYMFVEYGGGNITHFSFVDMEDKLITIERLCAKAFVIIDQDGDAKLKRKEELKAKLGDTLLILPCREIENSLPSEVIRSVVIEYETSIQNPNPETNSFVYEDYQNESLGEFIEDHVIKGEKHRRGSYKADSGTITDKLGFCTKALAYLKNLTFDQLPSTIQKEIEGIYKFIAKLNPS